MSPERYRRNSLRYPGYDYSQSGAYFATINTHLNRYLFGEVTDGVVVLSEPGKHVSRVWLALEERFPGVLRDEHVIMPNHIHGIIMLGADPTIPIGDLTVGIIVNSFKNSVLASWRKGVTEAGWPRYEKPLWHRDYYDRIIRNDAELEAYREYVLGNPSSWGKEHGG